eukprot:6473629-Amphidinium_carterae.3
MDQHTQLAFVTYHELQHKRNTCHVSADSLLRTLLYTNINNTLVFGIILYGNKISPLWCTPSGATPVYFDIAC